MGRGEKNAIPLAIKRHFTEILFGETGAKTVHKRETVFRTGKRVPSNANGCFVG
jgi:hypothetical protein